MDGGSLEGLTAQMLHGHTATVPVDDIPLLRVYCHYSS